jgi:ATP-dependent DNA helicase RecG
MADSPLPEAEPLSGSAPLAELEWIPRNRIAPLRRLGIETIADLILHYPRRHEDRRKFDRFPDGPMDRAVCICGVVAKTATKRFGGWRKMFEMRLEEEDTGMLGQAVTCRWFNMHFLSNMIATGDQVVVYGKPKERGKQIVIDHPEFEVIEDDGEQSIHLQRITPVHPAGDGISPRILRSLIHQALNRADLTTIKPFLAGEDGIPFAAALRAIHFPESFEQLTSARARLIREEFFGIQLILQARKARWHELPGAAKKARGKLITKLESALPFQLTASQQTVVGEILADLRAPVRMNRLLQGDVGSGKTLVALEAMLHTVESGWQAALMAPTQILAEQHYLNFKRLLEPLGISVALRTSARSENTSMPLFDKDAPGIIVGTHALLYEGTNFQKLGLAVIDEQHKFGVLQRAKLIEQGDAPDVLVMTATPIPRTLTQTLYGDLDVSILHEKPANRGEIQTAVRDMGKLPEVVDFVRKQLDKGRQAYIVYPLVDESEKLSAKSAIAEFEKWKSLLEPHAVGLVHGRLKPEEKEAVMSRFRDGTIHALVATTVIEVGVDVPNANIMVVENAERFGLAQLHQLRGRIGRGEHKSFCVLLHDPKAEDTAKEKLLVLEKTSDGFEIAEADLRLRGPGDLVGTAQTGLPPLRLGDIFADAGEMELARESVRAVLTKDPRLHSAKNLALRDFVERSERAIAAAAG